MSHSPATPDVIAVKPLDNYRLELTFANGECGVFDCNAYLDFGLFKELQDEHYFRSVQLWKEAGTIRWPHGQDFCPGSLYVASEKDKN
jgi:hypothetical protein